MSSHTLSDHKFLLFFRCRIDGKVAVITGADTDVGIEMVRELCKRGAERVNVNFVIIMSS